MNLQSTSFAGEQARGLILEEQGDLSELLAVSTGVVSAEEELAGQHDDPDVSLCIADVAAIGSVAEAVCSSRVVTA